MLFRFKRDATAEEVREVELAFAALPSKIGAIVGFEWGTNVSPEGNDQGFTHCFLVTFEDEAGLETYLPHAAHQEFVTLVEPIVDDVLVLDYVADG